MNIARREDVGFKNNINSMLNSKPTGFKEHYKLWDREMFTIMKKNKIQILIILG